MISLLQTHQNTGVSRRQSHRISPSVRTAYFDLGSLFSDVIVRPTTSQISRATREILFSEIDEPQNTRCPITQQDFSQNDTVIQIRHCGHIFYPDEINTWWERNVHCPVCRYDIRESVSRNTSNNLTRNENVNQENIELSNTTNISEDLSANSSINYNNRTFIPRIRTIPRTTFSRNSRATQPNPNTSISDQEMTSYINLATHLLNTFSQSDVSGDIDILYSI